MNFHKNIKKNSSLYLITKLWKLLKSKRKKQLGILLLIIILSGLIEIITIGTFIPFISALSNPDKLLNYKFINLAAQITNSYEDNNLVVLTTLIFIIFIIFSTLIRLLNIWLNYKMTAKIGSDISLRAYKRIIYQPYQYITSINSGELISITTSQLDFTVQAISLILRITTNFIVITFIGIGLIFLDYQLALLSGLFIIVPYVIISVFTKRIVLKNSKIINSSMIDKVKSIQDSLNLNKDIILNDLHLEFIQKYKKNDWDIRDKQTENNFLSMFPRYTMEGIGITFIALLSAIFTLIRSDNGNLIPYLGALTLAAQRLVPTMQQIYSGLANLRGYSSAIESVIKICDLTIPLEYINKTRNYLSFKKNISLKNVSYYFDDNNEKFILNNINLEIKKGEKIGIIGKTGSGKSTLINLISGFLKPTKGKIFIDNKNLYSYKDNNLIRSWYELISYVPQQIYLKDGTIWENISLCEKKDIDHKRMLWAAEQSLLNDFISKKEKGFETLVGEKGIKLSGGQCQRIGIARALYKKSEVILLDEATSALDLKTEKLLINNLMKLNNNFTIIFIAHRLSTLSNCSKIIEINEGKISDLHTPKSLGLND